VLGVQLTLPVLHRDGREISCRFLIEQLAAPAGRSLYLAHLDVLGVIEAAHGTSS
jgi:hypothetical protein